MSAASLPPPLPVADSGVIRAATEVGLGAAYDAVLTAAQAGSDWAWTALYRSLAPPLLTVLHAGGDPAPADTLGEIVVEVARGVRTFGGDEVALRAWVLAIAYRRLASQRRPRRSSVMAAGVPLELECEHVQSAVRAALTGSTAPQAAPPAFRQLRPVRRLAG